MRQQALEEWLIRQLSRVDMGGNHRYGWSWVGGCGAAYVLGNEHPELTIDDSKGAVFPGAMGHHFAQTYWLPPGTMIGKLEVLAHEQQLFIPMKYKPFRMSPTDTMLFDHESHTLGVFDYKFVKDLDWVELEAKHDNIEQVNLYAHRLGAKWFCILYIHKQSYDKLRVHFYPVDLELAKESIEKLNRVDLWMGGERQNILWTDLASGLRAYTPKGARFMCEASARSDYTGCPFQKHCLEQLTKQYGTPFESLVRYDEYLKRLNKGEIVITP